MSEMKSSKHLELFNSDKKPDNVLAHIGSIQKLNNLGSINESRMTLNHTKNPHKPTKLSVNTKNMTPNISQFDTIQPELPDVDLKIDYKQLQNFDRKIMKNLIKADLLNKRAVK